MSWPPSPTRRFSIVAGVVVARDAVSNIVRQQADALERWAASTGTTAEVRIFTTSSDVDDSRIWITPEGTGLLRDDHFACSDLILYNFAIYYGLFDTIQLAPRSARVVVFHHGVTPPSCFPPHEREVIHRSLDQTGNFHTADLVLTSSTHLRGEILAMGIPESQVVRTPYWVPFVEDLPEMPRPWSRVELDLLYLGRFSPAKGLNELLDAIAIVCQRSNRPVRLQMVGSQRFSPTGYVASLRARAEELGITDQVKFHFDVPPHTLRQYLGMADVLLLPSHHEGFCIPVLEALSNGAFVITSDAAALPETTGGLGLLHPVGDAEAIADQITQFADGWLAGRVICERGEWSQDQWYQALCEHLAQFTRARAETNFVHQVVEELPSESVTSPLSSRWTQVRDTLTGGKAIAPYQKIDPERDLSQRLRDGFIARTGYGKFVT